MVTTMNPLPTPSFDEELAELRAGKTAEACAKIVALHGPLVMCACRRVLRDEGLAEDAAQETFVLLMQKARSLPPGTSLAGWLYHAACRVALNHQRTAMRRCVRENSAEAMNQMMPDTEPNLRTEIEPHLDEAMLALPERQRVAADFIMRFRSWVRPQPSEPGFYSRFTDAEPGGAQAGGHENAHRSAQSRSQACLNQI